MNEKYKIKKIVQNLVSVSGTQKCSKIRRTFATGVLSRPGWGILQHSPDPLAGLMRPTSKGREKKGKRRTPSKNLPLPRRSTHRSFKYSYSLQRSERNDRN